jgi:hypothetical protein
MDVLMLSGQLVDIRESKFYWVYKGVGVAHSTVWIPKTT